MPEFSLRYKNPDDREQALAMAAAVHAKAEEVFGLDVAWEVLVFADSGNQPDFQVTGWVTDNDDVKIEVVLNAQAAVLETMQQAASTEQSVECWWQRVKGKWSGAKGLLEGHVPLRRPAS